MPATPFPFPLPIKIGTDICHVKRIYDILANRHAVVLGDQQVLQIRGKARARRFVHFVLTAEEVQDAVRRDRIHIPTLEDPEYATTDSVGKDRMEAMATFMAGRWAAKEAIMKAYPDFKLRFHDITVIPPVDADPDVSHPPLGIIKLLRTNQEGDEERQFVPLSISHDGDYATAVALGLHGSVIGKSPEPVETDARNKDISTDRSNYNTNRSKVEIQPPRDVLIRSHRPVLGNFRVAVNRLDPGIDATFLVNFFKLRFPSFICLSLQKNAKDAAEQAATVCFGLQKDAKRAVQELYGFKILGRRIVAKSLGNLLHLPEKSDFAWVWNDDYEKMISAHSGDEQGMVGFSGRPKQQESETQEHYLPNLRTEELSSIENVFQDNPVVPQPTPQEKTNYHDKLIWNSDEINKSENWDLIQGEPVHKDELEELLQMEEEKRQKEHEESAKRMKKLLRKSLRGLSPEEMEENAVLLQKERDAMAKSQKKKKWKQPKKRKGFFINP